MKPHVGLPSGFSAARLMIRRSRLDTAINVPAALTFPKGFTLTIRAEHLRGIRTMIKILVGVTFGLLGAAMTSGCVVRSEPALVVREPVVVRPSPVVVYEPAVVVPVYKYKYKHRGWGEDDQGENEQ